MFTPEGYSTLPVFFFCFFLKIISKYQATTLRWKIEIWKKKKIRFGSSSKPVWVGFSCSPHASELPDKHGHYVLLSEGARVQIHISIFFVLIPVCGDVHLCWTHVINQLSAAHFQKQRFIFPVLLLLGYSTLDHPRGAAEHPVWNQKKKTFNTSDEECGKKGMSEEQLRAETDGEVEGETQRKRKSACQSRVENSRAWWSSDEDALPLPPLKLQQWGSWWGNDASLITTSVVTITF